jgi:hypothetical protein
MRILVFVLVLLALGKIGMQQYLVDQAKSEVIIAAYRDRAVGACTEAATRKRFPFSPLWARATSVRLVIGRANLDVPLWQVDNALWQARYKNPYLLVTMSENPRKIFCEFDIVQGSASVAKL